MTNNYSTRYTFKIGFDDEYAPCKMVTSADSDWHDIDLEYINDCITEYNQINEEERIEERYSIHDVIIRDEKSDLFYTWQYNREKKIMEFDEMDKPVVEYRNQEIIFTTGYKKEKGLCDYIREGYIEDTEDGRINLGVGFIQYSTKAEPQPAYIFIGEQWTELGNCILEDTIEL